MCSCCALKDLIAAAATFATFIISRTGALSAVATDATDAKIQLHKSNVEAEGWMWIGTYVMPAGRPRSQNGTVGLGKFRRLRQCVIDQGT
jgi:hypothetical protein